MQVALKSATDYILFTHTSYVSLEQFELPSLLEKIDNVEILVLIGLLLSEH